MRRAVIPAVILAAAGAAALLLAAPPEGPAPLPVYGHGFTYYDIELVQAALAAEGIAVSGPTAITDHTISRYCPHPGGPRAVEYCTTTAVTGPSGEPMGNINLGGTAESPVLAIASLAAPSLESGRGGAHAVLGAVVESLVCDCWGDEPSEFATPAEWFESVDGFYAESGRGVRSAVSGLAGADLVLEVGPDGGGVLRTLLVLKAP